MKKNHLRLYLRDMDTPLLSFSRIYSKGEVCPK